MLNNYNLTMLTDFYEITMANGYFNSDIKDAEACFDVFFRRVPDGGGFAIMAGLEQIIAYMKRLSFTEEDTEYLRSKNCFSEDFLDFLLNFKFKCDVWSVPEGYPIFPHEPVMIVKGPLIQAQFVETFILLTINHQSLIATKANRIVRAAQGRPVMEFGSRRAQGGDGEGEGQERNIPIQNYADDIAEGAVEQVQDEQTQGRETADDVVGDVLVCHGGGKRAV